MRVIVLICCVAVHALRIDDQVLEDNQATPSTTIQTSTDSPSQTSTALFTSARSTTTALTETLGDSIEVINRIWANILRAILYCKRHSSKNQPCLLHRMKPTNGH